MGMIFSAYDIRGKGTDPDAREFTWNVGKAFAEWLSEQGAVIVATTQNADKAVVNSVIEGILLQGRNVINAGVADTQVIMSAVRDKKAVGGVLIDHNDLQATDIISLVDGNGVNVTSDNGLEEIGEMVISSNFTPASTKGQLVQLDN